MGRRAWEPTPELVDDARVLASHFERTARTGIPGPVKIAEFHLDDLDLVCNRVTARYHVADLRFSLS
jgi:hypothetical protein